MTTKFFTFNTSAAGVLWNVTANTGVYVAKDVTIGSTDNFALTGTGDTISVDIDGNVYGDLGGISLTAASNAIVQVGAGAKVGGDLTHSQGISLAGFDGSVENNGRIEGNEGMHLDGTLDLELHNNGTITGIDSAIHLAAGATGTFSLFNGGTIDSTLAGDSFGSLIVSEGTTEDIIFNVGVINGVVSLGGGDDLFFGGGAKAMTGEIGKLFAVLSGKPGTKVGAFVDGGDGKDQLQGTNFTDFLSGGKGSDVILGGKGADTILGSVGKDGLTGGAGADQFTFESAADSHGKGIDTIRDFSHKEHDILSFGFDAKPGTPDIDDFKFIGTHGFSGKPGELRYEIHKNETLVFGNTDSDKQPEFELHLTGQIHLENSDFAL